MKNIKLLLTTAIIVTLTSCVNGDDYNTPDLTGECFDIPVTKQVSEITSISTPDNPVQYIDPRDAEGNQIEVGVIEAYVTSSDEGGNFYKSISMVSVDKQIGFSIPVDNYNLYTKYEPGRKVFIKLDSLYYSYANLTDSYEIGNLYNNDEIGRLSGVEFQNIILRSCESVNEDVLVEHISIIDALDDSYINKLIEFDGVQFTDGSAGGMYYDESYPNYSFSNPTYPSNIGGATNHQITDADGNKIVVRVSEFASFAGKNIPLGSGKIRGVLTKYNGGYQFMIRTLNDVVLDQPRIDSNPPLVGGSATYLSTLNEPFTSYATFTQNFPAYINDAGVGSRYWQVRSFGGNQYIQMSSFGGTPEANRSLFIVPVNMTAANTLSFKTKGGFNNGAALKVYYSTNYVFGSDITTATLVDITASFAIDGGPSSGYSTNFLSSGVYNIPAGITGNGVFIFEYVGNGNGGVTTTMQIDDIVIN